MSGVEWSKRASACDTVLCPPYRPPLTHASAVSVRSAHHMMAVLTSWKPQSSCSVERVELLIEPGQTLAVAPVSLPTELIKAET